MKKNVLSIKNLHASVAGKNILKGVNLSVQSGEVHAIMGPNGAGKSTLALSIMGHPNYMVHHDTKLFFNNENILALSPEEKAARGLFISFQQPVEITGVSVLAFLRTAYKSLYPGEKIPLSLFKENVKNALYQVGLDESFMKRSINEGFSGGEKKRVEIAQLLILKPRFVILDEIDSGLDVDSLKIVARSVTAAVKQYDMGVLVITHYQRILHFLKPNNVHVLIDGKIHTSGKMSLVRKIEKEGYATV